MSDPAPMAVDTSVAVPLMVTSHEAHAAVLTWASGRRLALCRHALAETFAVLTRLPGDSRVAAEDAVRLIDDNFETQILEPSRAAGIHREFARLGVVGGAVNDGLIALAALTNGSVLATRDGRARSTYEAIGASVHLVGNN